MRLFLTLWVAVILATIADIAAYQMLPALSRPEALSGISPTGNAVFLAVLLLALTRGRRIEMRSVGSAIAVAAFLATIVGLVLFGANLHQTSVTAGLLMMSPIGTIGRFPPGADVPFTAGMQAWIVSAMALVAAGLILVSLLRRRT